MKKIFSGLFVLLFIVFLTGCGPDFNNKNIPAEDFIVLNKEKVVKTSSSFNLNLKILPENANNYQVTYSSSDKNILSVNENGLVTALEKGSAKITINVNDLSKDINLEIIDESLYFTNPVYEMIVGEEYVLYTNQKSSLISTNTETLSITNNTLKALKEGLGTVTASLYDLEDKLTIKIVKESEISDSQILSDTISNMDIKESVIEDFNLPTRVGEVEISYNIEGSAISVDYLSNNKQYFKVNRLDFNQDVNLIASFSLNGLEEVVTYNIKVLKEDQVTNKESPISSLYEGMLPSLGSPKLLVLMIEFSDYQFTPGRSKEKVEKMFFGENEDYHTVKTFYKTSSYGKLDLEGEVLPIYRASNNSSYYLNKYDDWASDALIKEAINYYDKDIDYSKFDTNNDSYIDNVVVIYSKAYDSDSNLWWAFNTNYEDPEYDDKLLKVDNVYVNNYIFASIEFLYEYSYEGTNINTFIHELGHSFGLDDYYDYDEFIGPKGGLGGADLMDHTEGDHNSFSKYLLGWIEPTIIDLSKTYQEEYILKSFVETGEFLLITNDQTKDIFSEYILVEYYTYSSLNLDSYYLTTDGIRIFHVDATLGNNTGSYWSVFKYDNSDEVKKLIRLIEADGKNNIETGRKEEDRVASNSDLFKDGGSYKIDINKNYAISFNSLGDKYRITIN